MCILFEAEINNYFPTHVDQKWPTGNSLEKDKQYYSCTTKIPQTFYEYRPQARTSKKKKMQKWMENVLFIAEGCFLWIVSWENCFTKEAF